MTKVPLFVQSGTFFFLDVGSFGIGHCRMSPEGNGNCGERREATENGGRGKDAGAGAICRPCRAIAAPCRATTKAVIRVS